MFGDFSFNPSSKGQSSHNTSSMESSVSPTSSRDTSPSFEEDYTRRSSASSTIDELSQHFDRHNLEPRRPDGYLDATPSRPRNVDPASYVQHKLNSSTNASHLWQQRQALARRQCASDHPSKPSTIHEGRLSDNKPYYPLSHRSPQHGNPSQSQWRDGALQAPSPFAPLPLSPPYSEDSESNRAHVLRAQHSYKLGRELRHSVSRDAIPKQRVVLKKIRRRKSSLRRAAAEERD